MGDDVENICCASSTSLTAILLRLQRGIIYIDEIDKLPARGGENLSITRDVSGEGGSRRCRRLLRAPWRPYRRRADANTGTREY